MYSNNRQDLKSRQTLQQSMHVISVVESSLSFYPLLGFLPEQLIKKMAAGHFVYIVSLFIFVNGLYNYALSSCGMTDGSLIKIISWYNTNNFPDVPFFLLFLTSTVNIPKF
jgi:hypothetical protein